MLRRRICLFCITKAQKYCDESLKVLSSDKIKSRKLLDKSFWWLKKSIFFAGKEELTVMKQIWPSKEEILAM